MVVMLEERHAEAVEAARIAKDATDKAAFTEAPASKNQSGLISTVTIFTTAPKDCEDLNRMTCETVRGGV